MAKGDFELFAYFTIALKVLKISDSIPKTLIKKLDGLYKNIQETPVYLIGQLGKNDKYTDCISGQEIIEYALSVILKSFQYVGGRIILVECINDDNLIEFYVKNGFVFLQEAELVQMVRFLP
ncbi:MAG: acetyltransferase [Firmicutes bacterium HGW-Firmicutes-8]|nr:MAG: acetyltransferase [Firmicutes bacterium HGW-Firmicutes-8]